MKRLIATRTCPSCKLVKLNFEQNLNHLGQPIGGITAWCWVCNRGYYLKGKEIRDISIRCSKREVIVPAHHCRICPDSEPCLKEMMK